MNFPALYSKQPIQIFCSGKRFGTFFGNVIKVKIPSETKPPLGEAIIFIYLHKYTEVPGNALGFDLYFLIRQFGNVTKVKTPSDIKPPLSGAIIFVYMHNYTEVPGYALGFDLHFLIFFCRVFQHFLLFPTFSTCTSACSAVATMGFSFMSSMSIRVKIPSEIKPPFSEVVIFIYLHQEVFVL